MSEPYKYPPSAVFPIPDSGNLNLVRKLDDGISIANIESWSHFYDYSQDLNDGSGINHPFPSFGYTVGDGRHSKEWWLTSGVVNTYGSDARLDLVNEDESGIFSFDGVKGSFSLSGTKRVAVDFNLFQPYIHHGHDDNEEKYTTIPYISDYTISIPFNPYPYA
tara:strand:- start:1469 stop:1957 length:489 start_codon:yes stop_codon:yes gene_type:complete